MLYAGGRLMKKRIIIITLIFILAGSAVLGFDIVNLTPDEAYDSALENNLQKEIDELNHELKQISVEKSEKNASHTPINTYQGKITKYVTPFDAITNLTVSEMNMTKADEQLMVSILSAMVSVNDSKLAYGDTKSAYDLAQANYLEALGDSSIPSAELLSLEYTAENERIKLLQTEKTYSDMQSDLDSLLGVKNASVELPTEYSSPYSLDSDEVYESMLQTDVSYYQTERSLESAQMRHEIATQFYDEEDETYISTLASLKTAELNHDKKLLSLNNSAIDKIDNLKNKYDSIELEKLNVQIKKELYDASVKQYEAGIISEISFESSKTSYENATKQLDSKINSYIIACLQFTIDTGLGF